MKKESKVERILKYPLRKLEEVRIESDRGYSVPTSIEEAASEYRESRAMAPILTVIIPAYIVAGTFYGIAEGGRYLYDKYIKN